MTYLRGRGFRDDIIKKFQLGYSLDSPDALAKAALQKGYKEEFLLKQDCATARTTVRCTTVSGDV